MPAKKGITHCIFDMDGLLLNTEAFYTTVQKQILAEYGYDFTWELKAQMMGKKALEAAEWLIDKLQLEGRLSAQEFLDKREKALDGMFPQAELLPGAEKLLRHLKRHHIPMCLATSSHKRHYELKTARHAELFALFEHRVTGDQVSRGKPAPDIFQRAASLFRPEPEAARCLVFEDAPSGVQAAKNAGMSVIMVPDPQLDKKLTLEADSTIPSLLSIDLAAWGLPPLES